MLIIALNYVTYPIMRRLGHDQRAVTALEYGLIASVMALALVGMFAGLRTSLSTLFGHIDSSL